MADEMREFLELLFGTKDASDWVLIWTLAPDGQKLSYWFQDLDTAAAQARTMTDRNVYVGMGLSPENYGPRNRCDATRIKALSCLWVDVDIADPVHSKPNLASADQAMALIRRMPAPPSAIINSGHGLQAFWAFKEPWQIENENERKRLENVSFRWQRLLQKYAGEIGCTVDSTHDLARVMRLPGTMNVKAEPVPVTIINRSDWRAGSLEDFEALLPSDIPTLQSTATSSEAWATIQIVLSPDAEPPADKLRALSINVPKFGKTFKRKRSDLTDQSASGYDLSLANQAMEAEWTDQEIVDLLIAARRQAGDDLKLDRVDYYQRTLASAKASLARREAEKQEHVAEHQIRQEREQRLQERLALDTKKKLDRDQKAQEKEQLTLETSQKDAELDALLTQGAEAREQIKAEVFAQLGIKIEKIIKYTTSEPSYALQMEGKQISMPNVDCILSQASFLSRVAALTGFCFTMVKQKQWYKIRQLLLYLAEEEDLGEETSEQGQARLYIEGYLQSSPLVDMEHDSEYELETALKTHSPILKDGIVYVSLSGMASYLRARLGFSIATKTLGILLRSVDAKPKTLGVRKGGVATTASMYALPMDMQRVDVKHLYRDKELKG
jgi:hypothetical protein